MACLLDLAGKILGPPISYIVGEEVMPHAGYIFRYKKNIKELEDEKNKLEQMMTDNEKKVEEAEERNDVVEEKVEEWKQEAEVKKREVENLVDKARNENVKCLKFFCPNLCSRYRMSKEAVQKKVDIEGHIKGGNFEIFARSRPPPVELQIISTGDLMNFDSRETILNLIKDKLKSGNPIDYMIGVHGAGGIGKTTIVKEAGKQLEGVFDKVVVGVVSRDVNVHEIQKQLAHRFCLDIASKTEAESRDALWNRFNNGKNFLVILDDLWEEIKLTDIGIPLRPRNSNKGCKVISTTRNCQVLRNMEVGESFLVKELSKQEAWALFEKKVGVKFAPDELRDMAESVCEECQGLPVAILAVGGTLARKTDKRIWKAAEFVMEGH